jgi:hypothetical protein
MEDGLRPCDSGDGYAEKQAAGRDAERRVFECMLGVFLGDLSLVGDVCYWSNGDERTDRFHERAFPTLL